MDLEQEAARRVGSTLCHKWTLDRLIGTGGMAAVYVATHRIGRREAIKILHSDVAKDPELRARFEQEAHAVNRFKHPGAVDVRDIDVAEDGAPFLVMELLEGEPLSSVARRDAAPLGELLRWTDELLDVLAAAHAQGIIHRDIKPDNLFVQSDGHLKVLDFGIAQVRFAAISKPQTRAGETLGTATYMPPEQIHGTGIDARADLFAVGATLFRLITKRRIHEASNEADILVKMGSLQAPRLTDIAPEIARDVGLVVDRALMFHPEDRYPDARTMQGDVRALREGGTPLFATAALGRPARPAHEAPTLPAAGAPPSLATRAASPVALQSSFPPPPDTVDAQRIVIDEPATARPRLGSNRALPATNVLPVVQTTPEAPITMGGDSPSPPQALVAMPPVVPNLVPPSAPSDSTLRSVVGLEAGGGHNLAQGYAVEVVHPTPRVTERPGPSTQISGLEAVHVAAPGESIRVVEPPPRPHFTLPGTDVRLWPLIVVGLVFASIGVAVTLFFMLRAEPATESTPSPQPTATHPAEATLPQHPPTQPAQHPGSPGNLQAHPPHR